MKYLLLLAMAGCMITARPIDIVHPGPPYCEYVTTHRQICRDAAMRVWDCHVVANGWSCYLVRR